MYIGDHLFCNSLIKLFYFTCLCIIVKPQTNQPLHVTTKNKMVHFLVMLYVPVWIMCILSTADLEQSGWSSWISATSTGHLLSEVAGRLVPSHLSCLLLIFNERSMAEWNARGDGKEETFPASPSPQDARILLIGDWETAGDKSGWLAHNLFKVSFNLFLVMACSDPNVSATGLPQGFLDEQCLHSRIKVEIFFE